MGINSSSTLLSERFLFIHRAFVWDLVRDAGASNSLVSAGRSLVLFGIMGRL